MTNDNINVFIIFFANELFELQQVKIFARYLLQNLEQKQTPEVFYKKVVLKNFTKFTGKHLRQGLFFDKVAGLGLQLY